MSRLLPLFPLLLVAAAPPPPASTIRFEEIAGKAGLKFVSSSSPTANKNQPETMVAGVALLDYDGDGYLDIYLVAGAAIPSLQKDGEQYKNRLFHNNGNLTFTDVTDKAGVAGAGYGMGVAVGDYDNDGRPDIYLANVTDNQLFHNNGNGTFTDVTAKAGVAGGILDGKKMWSVAAGWFDYNNDGKLDLFLSNYCKWEVNKDPFCGPRRDLRMYCHPKNYVPLPNTLYRNNGDGTFTDVSAETGIAKYPNKGMGVVFADYDGDGWTDVFVANDNSQNLAFHNLKGQKFEEVSLQLGVAYPDTAMPISGMGADFRDVNNDGLPDIWHTAIENETFPLFLNRGDGLFNDVTSAIGLGRITREMSGWSNFIADLDNDGWKDLFVARGNVLDNVDQTKKREYGEPNSVIRNLGGAKLKFEDVTTQAGPDFQLKAPHRGVAVGDLDNDGRLDAVVTVLNGPAKIFHNVSTNGNHWLLLQLAGTKSNRMGIGTRVRITAEDGSQQWNEATTSTGYASSSDPRVHFGLGAVKRVKEIELLWPSGARQVLKDVTANRIIKVEEPGQ